MFTPYAKPRSHASTSPPLAVEATALRKSYGPVAVLDDIDLAVPRGTVFALLGPNGAGKTTTVRILTTLLRPDGGRVRVAGHDVIADVRAVRRAISVCSQDATLDDLQTGAENLAMVARLRGLRGDAVRARVGELLERFDLAGAAARRVGTYSGGMRRRLDLAACLVTRPEVLFLDEPTTGLDPRARRAMWDLLGELIADGVTAVLTTQYLEEADVLAERIAVLDGGRIVAEGQPAELKARVARERLELAFADDDALAQVAAALGPRAVAVDRSARKVQVGTDGSAAHVRALLAELDPGGDRVARFALHTATLDEVFLALTGREQAHV